MSMVEKKITPSLEDYLESILMLIENRKEPRTKDIAEILGVKAPSVVEAVSNLEKSGYIIHKKYGRIELTEKGYEAARNVYERHILLKKFFKDVLCLDSETSENDACKIEHFLSEKTVERIVNFVDFVEKNPDEHNNWKKYLRGINQNERK